jgi:hypothetical protein
MSFRCEEGTDVWLNSNKDHPDTESVFSKNYNSILSDPPGTSIVWHGEYPGQKNPRFGEKITHAHSSTITTGHSYTVGAHRQYSHSDKGHRKLLVRIIGLELVTDTFSLTKPYCKVQLANSPHKRTNACSPCGQDWNQDLYFDLSENLNDHSINIHVCDEGSTDLVLDAKINIEQIFKKNNLHGLYAIFDCNKTHAGRIRVLMVYPADENSPDLNKEITSSLASTN